MKLTLNDDHVKLIIHALDYCARMEAGQTQAPNLCEPEDYQEYELARSLERRLNLSTVLRSQWFTDPQTGEPLRR